MNQPFFRDPRLSALAAGVPITWVCESCCGICDLDDVRADGVVAYRCRNANCPARIAIVAPMKERTA